MTHAGDYKAMTDKKKEATSIPLEGKTAAELHVIYHVSCVGLSYNLPRC